MEDGQQEEEEKEVQEEGGIGYRFVKSHRERPAKEARLAVGPSRRRKFRDLFPSSRHWDTPPRGPSLVHRFDH